MSVKKKLKDLYLSKMDGLASISNSKLVDSGPLLTDCWEEEFSSVNHKILIIGQQTNGWDAFDEGFVDIDRLQRCYSDFRLSCNTRFCTSPFWQAAHHLRESLNPNCSEVAFQWTNIWKYDSNNSAPPKELQQLELLHFNVLKDEISIIDPDIVIFFTGPNYDGAIKAHLDDASFSPFVKGVSERSLAMVKSRYLPEKSYRSYHPGYLRRSKQWDHLQHILSDYVDS